MANKWVYMFSEGNMSMRNLLGGKGANLAEMTDIGLPVPQGFTITTEACTQYYEDSTARLTTKSWHRLWKALRKWKRSTERNSETSRIHYLFLFVPVLEHLCQV